MCFQYIGGYHDACGDIMMHVGDIMSTSRGYNEYIGGYHEYIRGCSVHWGDIMMHVGKQVGKNLSISIENPDVLMISPDVLMVPLMYSWCPPMY